jgi:hypothetical protein
MRQGHLDDLAALSGDDLPELADALGVSPVAVADGRSSFVEPDDVAAFECPRLANGPENGPALPGTEVADHAGLFSAQELSHPAENDALSGHTGGVADVDRIEPGPGFRGKKMDIGYEAAQDVGEAVVFGGGSPEVRLLHVAQGFPLSSDVVLVVPGLPRMFEEKALDRSDFGQGAKGHIRSLLHSGRGPGLARGSTSAVLARGYKPRASGEPKARPLTNIPSFHPDYKGRATEWGLPAHPKANHRVTRPGFLQWRENPGFFAFLLNFRAFPPFMNRIHICNLLIIKAIMNAHIFSVDFR